MVEAGGTVLYKLCKKELIRRALFDRRPGESEE